MDWNTGDFGDRAMEAEQNFREVALKAQQSSTNTILQTQICEFVEAGKTFDLAYSSAAELAASFVGQRLKNIGKKVKRLEVRDAQGKLVHTQDIKWDDPKKSLEMMIRQVNGIQPPLQFG